MPEVARADFVDFRIGHREPHFRVVPVFMHRADFVAEVSRRCLYARPLELGEPGDGAVGFVAREEGFLGAALGVGARGTGGRRARRGDHRGGAETRFASGPVG